MADTDGARASGGPTPSRWRRRRSTAIVAYIQALIDRGARLRGRAATSTSACARTRRTARSRTARSTTWTRARASRAPHLKEDPLDFALWKAAEGGRGHGVGRALGPRPAGLAHRVLGDGRGGCWAWASRSTAAATTSIFPHHENEAAQTRMARDAELAQIWMHNGMLQMGAEKMAKSRRQRRAAARGARGVRAATRDHVLRQRPLPRADGVRRRRAWQQAAARVRRVREAGRRLVDGASPADMASYKERFFEALRDDFNTPAALAARVRVDPRGELARATWAATTCVEMLERPGAREPARARGRRGGRRGRGAAASAREDGPRGQGLRRGRPAARRAARARLGGPRRAVRARARARAVIVYGRQPVAELLRAGRRRGATRSGRRAEDPWLSRSSAATAGRADGARGHRCPPGRRRGGRALSVRRRGRAAREARRAA